MQKVNDGTTSVHDAHGMQLVLFGEVHRSEKDEDLIKRLVMVTRLLCIYNAMYRY